MSEKIRIQNETQGPKIKRYRTKSRQVESTHHNPKYKTTSHIRSIKYPAIADVITANMKNEKLYEVLNFLSKLQQKFDMENQGQKNSYNNENETLGASIEESLIIEEVEEFVPSILTSSPSSPNFGFKNPRSTLNGIINSPEFNKANLNNFPSDNDDNKKKSIHSIKKRKKKRGMMKGRKRKPKFRDFSFPKIFDKKKPFPLNQVKGLRYNCLRLQEEEFKNVKRLSKYLKEKSIFHANVANYVHPDDVYLGGITKIRKNYKSSKPKSEMDILDSYSGSHLFYSILSVLALEPALVKRIVQVKSINNYGVYTVWINFEGFWQKVVIDDYFPIKNKNLKYGKINPKTGSVWPIMIEKAYAKCYNSYTRIPKEENVSFYLRDLTGAPVLSIPLEFNKDITKHQGSPSPGYLDYTQLGELQLAEAEEVWEILKEAFEKGYIALTTIKIGNQKKNYELAFPVINFLSLKTNEAAPRYGEEPQFERYVQVKQAFGLELLPKTSKAVRERFQFCNISINFEEEEKDKLIWMSYAEFLSYFNELAVAMVNPNHVFGAIGIRFNVKSYSRIESSKDFNERKQVLMQGNHDMKDDDFHESFRSLVKFTVWVEGEYTISFNKPHQDKFLDYNKKCKNLKIRNMSAITIGRLNNDRVEFIDSKFDGFRNTVIHRDFEVGEYVILLDIRYSLKNQSVLTKISPDWKDCTISTYGPSTCSIMELEQDISGMENLEIIYGYFEHKIWKEFVNNPPGDMSDYVDRTVFSGIKDVHMINGDIQQVKCQSLSINHLIIEELRNDDPKIGLTFEKDILSCVGYEAIGPTGRPLYKNRYRMYLNPMESEILVLRFGIGVNREFKTRMM